MDIAISTLVLTTQAVRRVYPDLAVSVHQLGEVLSVHESQLARGGGFSGNFVGHARNGGAQSHRSPRFYGFENQDLAFTRSSGKIDLARANDEQPTGRLAFNKQDRARWQCALMADCVK